MNKQTKRLVKKIVKAYGPDLLSITVSDEYIEIYYFNYRGDLIRNLYSGGIEITETIVEGV